MAARPNEMIAPPVAYPTLALPNDQTGSADVLRTDAKITQHKAAIISILTVSSNLMLYLKDLPEIVQSLKALCVHFAFAKTRLNTTGDAKIARRLASTFVELMTPQNAPLPTCRDDLGKRLIAAPDAPGKAAAYKEWIRECWTNPADRTQLHGRTAALMEPAPALPAPDSVTPETRTFIDHFRGLFANWDANDAPSLMNAYFDVVESRNPRELSHLLLKDLIFATISFAKAGEMTPNKFEKIKDALSNEHGLRLNIDHDQIRPTYRMIRLGLSGHGISVAEVMRRLSFLFPVESFLRLHLTIKQSLGVGASVIGMINDAIKTASRHPIWAYIIRENPLEWNEVVSALRALSRDGYSALGLDSEIVKSTRFPNFACASYALLSEAGHSGTLQRYKGKILCNNEVQITAIIATHKTAAQAAITQATVMEMQLVDWNSLLPDLGLIRTLTEQATLVGGHAL